MCDDERVRFPVIKMDVDSFISERADGPISLVVDGHKLEYISESDPNITYSFNHVGGDTGETLKKDIVFPSSLDVSEKSNSSNNLPPYGNHLKNEIISFNQSEGGTTLMNSIVVEPIKRSMNTIEWLKTFIDSNSLVTESVQLIFNGENVNQVDEYGNSSLHLASDCGRGLIVHL